MAYQATSNYRVDGSWPCDVWQSCGVAAIIVGVVVLVFSGIAGAIVIGCGVVTLVGASIWRLCGRRRHRLI